MNRKLLIPALVLAAVAGVGASSFFKRDTALTASGTLEARNISVGSKVGGRVTKVLAAEGDRVGKDQLLITFDAAELDAVLVQARGRYAQAQANLARLTAGYRPEEIAQAQAVGRSRQQAIQQAEALAERAGADAAHAEAGFRRYERLFSEGVVSREQRDATENRNNMAQAQAASAQHAVTVARSEAAAAAEALRLAERGFRREDIAAARADLERAEGELMLARARHLEREVRSPADAVVEVLELRPGDLVAANAAVARLLEAAQLYVVVYVPQSYIGKIRLGQTADVMVDAFPDQAFKGVVEQIRQRAEFLPRNVQTKEEREHQVVGVKLRVENPEAKLRAGINADVRFHEVN